MLTVHCTCLLTLQICISVEHGLLDNGSNMSSLIYDTLYNSEWSYLGIHSYPDPGSQGSGVVLVLIAPNLYLIDI